MHPTNLLFIAVVRAQGDLGSEGACTSPPEIHATR